MDGGGVLVGVPDVDTLAELVGAGRAEGTVLLLHGDLVREPLMPASFPFYAVPEHDRIRELLAGSGAVAVVSATGRSPQTAGAVEPFPFVEDGDFPVPAADVHVRELPRLLAWTGRPVRIGIDAHRRPARARNVEARLGRDGRRVVVIAHVDSKPGTPGALDNAAGVVAVLQLAALLVDHRGRPWELPAVEILVVNGEDYFSAAGEVDWLRRNGGLDSRADRRRPVGQHRCRRLPA